MPLGDTAGSAASRGLVVVVEDERPISDLIRLYLSREGFGVEVATDGPGGVAAVRRLSPVAVILDVGLPGMDGTDVCRALRAEGLWMPVLFVTARGDEIDRVVGLELGGDDYITKPFSPRELVARVKAAIRRADGPATPAELSYGAVRVDLAGCRVFYADAEVTLTPTEFQLLVYLLRRPGRAVSREQLLSAVWGYAAAAGTRTVDVHVAQLRAKFGGGCPIRTVRGVGYAADAAPGADPRPVVDTAVTGV